MYDIIKAIKSLEDSSVLIDVVLERVKHETKKKKTDFLELGYHVEPLHWFKQQLIQ